MFRYGAARAGDINDESLHVLLGNVAKKRESRQYLRRAGRGSGKDSRPIMEETLSNAVVSNGNGLGHDNGFAYSVAGAPSRAAPPAAPSCSELRAELSDLVAAGPTLQPEDSSLLALMALHDAGIATALTKLPERDGAGGATVATLVRKYRGAIDPYQTACEVVTTLIFWPEPVPADEALCEAVLRLAEHSIDAARELARAYTFLGPRFTLKN